LPTPFAKHEKRGRWAWPITAGGHGRANFGPPGPAGAAKKNGWAGARARPGPGPLKKNAPNGKHRLIVKLIVSFLSAYDDDMTI